MVPMHNGEKHDHSIWTVDMYGHDWLGWVGVVFYFLSILSAVATALLLVTWAATWVYEEAKWKWLNWKADRNDRKHK